MSSPMFDLSDEQWRDVDIHATKDGCPLGKYPEWECEIAYEQIDGRWVKGCSMAGISAACWWAHPEIGDDP